MAAESGTDLGGGGRAARDGGIVARGQDLAAHLAHLHLLLHLDDLLLLGPGEGPGDAEQQDGAADDPEGLAADGERRADGARDGPDLGRDVAPRRRRDDVAQRVQPVR